MKKLSIFLAIALLLCHLQLCLMTTQAARHLPKQTADKYADKLRAFEDFVLQQEETKAANRRWRRKRDRRIHTIDSINCYQEIFGDRIVV